jgi:hypothetical protein
VLVARLVPVVVVTLALLALPASVHAQEGDRDCGDFASQADAQAFFDANDPDLDPHRLDSDADYLACESNLCPCSGGAEPEPPPSKPKPRGFKLERAEGGVVVAEFSYMLRNHRYSHRRIKIAREGLVLIDEALPHPPGCDARCSRFVSPTNPTGRGPVWVRDLDADGEPEVAVDLWTGGANCCTFTVVYGFRPATDTYKRVSEVWGTAYRLRRLGRDDELQFWGFDQRFKYAFSCGACAPLPLRIWQYRASRLSVATREFPAAVRRSARRSWRAYVRARQHPSAFIRGSTRGSSPPGSPTNASSAAADEACAR